MSCSGWASSFFELVCKDADQAKKIEKIINDSHGDKIFTAWKHTGNGNVLSLDFWDSEVYRTFDDRLEETYQWIKETFGLEITGYMVEEVEGLNYRCEFDENGKLQYEEIGWLSDYTTEQIKQIKIWASIRFNREKSNAELHCPKCNEKRMVVARMEHLEYCNVNVLTDKDGRCELDWENSDTSGDFEYCCEFCGAKLAQSLDEVERKLKAEMES